MDTVQLQLARQYSQFKSVISTNSFTDRSPSSRPQFIPSRLHVKRNCNRDYHKIPRVFLPVLIPVNSTLQAVHVVTIIVWPLTSSILTRMVCMVTSHTTLKYGSRFHARCIVRPSRLNYAVTPFNCGTYGMAAKHVWAESTFWSTLPVPIPARPWSSSTDLRTLLLHPLRSQALKARSATFFRT